MMKLEDFNRTVQGQLDVCKETLIDKGLEYAPEEIGVDRLAHFKKAAVIIQGTEKQALLGMLAKHLVSVSDMCLDSRKYPLAQWVEKITDSMNYLLILRAMVEEEEKQNG